MTPPKQRMGSGALDWRDFVTGLGSGDDAAAIVKAFGKLLENTPTLNPGLDVSLLSTLALSNRAGLRLMSGCDPRPNGGGASPVFRWGGPDDGGPMILLDRCLYPELSGFTMELDGNGSTAYTALDLDGFGGTGVPGQPFYGYGSGATIDRMVFLAHRANPNYEMVRMSHTVDQNQEYQAITRSNFNGGDPLHEGDACVGTAVTVGASANAKAERLDDCGFSRFGVAVKLLGGSAHLGAAVKNSYTNNEIDILRLGASEPSISRANSEASRQHLVDRMGYGFTILGGTRLHNGWQKPGIDNAYIVAGQLLDFQGSTQFDSRPPAGGFVFNPLDCMSLTGGPIIFAPGTLFSETGLGMMPLTPDRYMDVILYNVVDDETGLSFPRRYIRGSYRHDCVADREAIHVRATATSGIPDFEAVRTEIEQSGDGVGAGGQYAALGMTFTKTKGGAPADVRAVRSNV